VVAMNKRRDRKRRSPARNSVLAGPG